LAKGVVADLDFAVVVRLVDHNEVVVGWAVLGFGERSAAAAALTAFGCDESAPTLDVPIANPRTVIPPPP
jgi:hypothetical protein